jgi:hypothetical protein
MLCIAAPIHKSQSPGECLKPLLLTLRAPSLVHCPHQDNEGLKPKELVITACSFCHALPYPQTKRLSLIPHPLSPLCLTALPPGYGSLLCSCPVSGDALRRVHCVTGPVRIVLIQGVLVMLPGHCLLCVLSRPPETGDRRQAARHPQCF